MKTKRLTKEQLRLIYESLKREAKEIEAFLAQVAAKEQRLRSLKNHWGSIGEIECARRDLRDADFPIWGADGVWTQYLVDVNDKWIVIRQRTAEDGDVELYNRRTGLKKGTRASWRSPIDVAHAVKLWKDRAGLRTERANADGACSASTEIQKPEGAGERQATPHQP